MTLMKQPRIGQSYCSRLLEKYVTFSVRLTVVRLWSCRPSSILYIMITPPPTYHTTYRQCVKYAVWVTAIATLDASPWYIPVADLYHSSVLQVLLLCCSTHKSEIQRRLPASQVITTVVSYGGRALSTSIVLLCFTTPNKPTTHNPSATLWVYRGYLTTSLYEIIYIQQ